MQKITRAPMRAVLAFFCGFSAAGQENFNKLEAPFIMMSNHAGYIDSYVVASAVPFFKYLKYPPTRFMTYQEFIDRPILGRIIKAYGAYPIERHSGKPMEEVLSSTLEFLKKGDLIMIYPEGKLPKNPAYDAKARPGVAYLAKETGLPVLPAAIKKESRRFFFPKFAVVFGAPFCYKDVAEEGDDLRDAAGKMMERVRVMM